MTPEREFILTALSRYLEQQPQQAKSEAIDLCAKYLEQQEKISQLQEHCQLLEEKIEEMKIDYDVLQAELENERHISQVINPNFYRSAALPDFLSNNS